MNLYEFAQIRMNFILTVKSCMKLKFVKNSVHEFMCKYYIFKETIPGKVSVK